MRVGLNGRATTHDELELEGKLGDVYDTQGHLVYDKDYVSRIDEEVNSVSLKPGTVHSDRSKASKASKASKGSRSESYSKNKSFSGKKDTEREGQSLNSAGPSSNENRTIVSAKGPSGPINVQEGVENVSGH